MKKLLKWVLPAFLGIMPILGTDQADKDFLNRPNTIYSISDVYEDGNGVRAIVDATPAAGESMQQHVKALFTHIRWEHDDPHHFSKSAGKILVFSSNGRNEKPYTRKEEHPYILTEPTRIINLLAGETLTNANLPLDQAVETYEQTVYERKDNTLYIEKKGPITVVATPIFHGERVQVNKLFDIVPVNMPVNVVKMVSGNTGNLDSIIYQLILRQRNVISSFNRCYEHKGEVCNQGLFKITNKLRHWWETYEKTDQVTEIFKLSDGQETIIPGISKSVPLSLRRTERDSGRTNHPDCAGQKELPKGYLVII